MRIMKKFIISVEVNGGEYYTYVTITGNELQQIDSYSVRVDGVTIKFDGVIII